MQQVIAAIFCSPTNFHGRCKFATLDKASLTTFEIDPWKGKANRQGHGGPRKAGGLASLRFPLTFWRWKMGLRKVGIFELVNGLQWTPSIVKDASV